LLVATAGSLAIEASNPKPWGRSAVFPNSTSRSVRGGARASAGECGSQLAAKIINRKWRSCGRSTCSSSTARILRDLPLDRRKSELKALLKRAPFVLALNDYAAGDGPELFAQACAMGLEGIVSKRRSSPYRSGRSPHWLKAENPESVFRRAD
jgi:hypothetical protein